MELKILLIGTTEVGKTSILSRYTGDIYDERFVATVGIDFKVKQVTWNDEDIKLQIWDTAGQERYRAITTAYYRGAVGFLLVFSLTNRKSFTNLHDWIKLVRENSGEDVPFILVGNKSDLNDQVITTEEAQKYADSVGQEYFETSSKTGFNINEVFEALLKKILKPEGQSEDNKEVEPIPPEVPNIIEDDEKLNEEQTLDENEPDKHEDVSMEADKEEKQDESGQKEVEESAPAKVNVKDPIRLEKNERKCEHPKHEHSFCSC